MQRSVANRLYKGPIDCAKQIIGHQGVLGLWTGFTGSLAFRANFLWMFGSFEVVFAMRWHMHDLTSSDSYAGFNEIFLNPRRNKVPGELMKRQPDILTR